MGTNPESEEAPTNLCKIGVTHVFILAAAWCAGGRRGVVVSHICSNSSDANVVEESRKDGKCVGRYIPDRAWRMWSESPPSPRSSRARHSALVLAILPSASLVSMYVHHDPNATCLQAEIFHTRSLWIKVLVLCPVLTENDRWSEPCRNLTAKYSRAQTVQYNPAAQRGASVFLRSRCDGASAATNIPAAGAFVGSFCQRETFSGDNVDNTFCCDIGGLRPCPSRHPRKNHIKNTFVFIAGVDRSVPSYMRRISFRFLHRLRYHHHGRATNGASNSEQKFATARVFYCV